MIFCIFARNALAFYGLILNRAIPQDYLFHFLAQIPTNKYSGNCFVFWFLHLHYYTVINWTTMFISDICLHTVEVAINAIIYFLEFFFVCILPCCCYFTHNRFFCCAKSPIVYLYLYFYRFTY